MTTESNPPEAQPNYFTLLYHQYLGGPLFLTGSLLLTVSTVVALIFYRTAPMTTLNWFNFLPLIAYWVGYAGTKGFGSPGKSAVLAVRILRVYAVVSLVVIGLGSAGVLVMSGFLGGMASIFAGNESGGFGILMIGVLFFMVGYTVYFLATMKVWRSLNDNITQHASQPLRGIKVFMGFSLVIHGVALGYISPFADAAFYTLIVMAAPIGGILIVCTLWRLHQKLVQLA